jgi:16S rRNA (uracil1498-N3)-methyltransferase
MEHSLPRFYHAHLNAETLELDGQEAQHAIKVLRMQTGEQLELFDGHGHIAVATITAHNKRTCSLRIVSRLQEPNPMPYAVHLVVAPVKSMDRFSWLLEKATEVGVSSITPVITANSERRHLSHEKAEAIVLAAMKQSRRSWMPVLHHMVTFQEWMHQLPAKKILMAHCRDSERTALEQVYEPGEDVYILIGPEGDFTGPEVSNALDRGCIPVTLGLQRLRTETAALQALMHIHFLNVPKL